MDQTLECLLNLQKSDLDRITQLQSRDELQKRLVILESLLERGQGELTEKQEKLANAEAFYRKKSLELKTEVERAKEAKAKLNNVTKQKEFLANQKEVEYLKRSNSKREEEIVNLMEAIDEYKAGISENESRIAELQAQFDEEKKANAERLTELDSAIAKLDAARSELTSGLKSSLLKRYERILKAREGQAIVTVDMNGTCAGCHMRIQPHAVQQLLKSKSFSNCPSCQRFIYVTPPETVGVAAAE